MKRTYIKRVIAVIAMLLMLSLALFALGVLWPVDTLEAVRSTTPIAIVDVSVVDAKTNQVVPHQTVVVQAGRIVGMGDRRIVALPANARVVDGRGRFLLPALWDMHTHVYAFAPLLDLPLYIANGVTNVRDMQGCPQPDDPFIACAEDKRRWTAEAVAGKRIGPRIVASTSFMADGPGMLKKLKDAPLFYGTATPTQARQFVRHFAGKVDAIKVYNRIPRDAYFALVDEARRLNIDVVGHRPYAISAIEAATHQKSIEHARFVLHETFSGSTRLREQAGSTQWREDRRRMLDEHNPRMAQAIFDAMKRNGTWYVPTHLTRWVDAYADHASVREDPLLRYMHPLLQWQWLEDVDETLADDPSAEARETYRQFHAKGLALTGSAHRAGVKVLAGTDYGLAGVHLHKELEQLVAAGLTPAEALVAATLAPAEYFGLQGQYGSVAVGKTADLLLLSANPLEDIRNTQHIDAVFFNGNLYDRQALDRISDHVQRQANSWSVGCKILWRFIQHPASY